MLAAAGTAYFFVIRDQGPPHPDSWDKRLQEYVDVVEKERGLDFEHPVYVDFLSDADFTKQVTADEKDLSADDRKEIEQFTGLFRALGLLEGDVDLFEQTNELNGAGIVGYYSYEDERIRVRGKELTPAVESTLVHELTHVLQDQRFDLEAMKDRAEDDDAVVQRTRRLDRGRRAADRDQWRDGLTRRASRRRWTRTRSRSRRVPTRRSSKVPEVLKTLPRCAVRPR